MSAIQTYGFSFWPPVTFSPEAISKMGRMESIWVRCAKNIDRLLYIGKNATLCERHVHKWEVHPQHHQYSILTTVLKISALAALILFTATVHLAAGLLLPAAFAIKALYKTVYLPHQQVLLDCLNESKIEEDRKTISGNNVVSELAKAIETKDPSLEKAAIIYQLENPTISAPVQEEINSLPDSDTQKSVEDIIHAINKRDSTSWSISTHEKKDTISLVIDDRLVEQDFKEIQKALGLLPITNILVNFNMPLDDFKRFVKILTSNKSVFDLNLKECEIQDEGALALCDLLKENSTLRMLHLQDNDIGIEGAKALCEVLSEHSSITHLILSGNLFGEEGIIHISNMLKKNKSILELHLNSNDLNDEALIPLGAALEENQTLTKLFLGGNAFGDKGGEILANGLKVNHSIVYLDLANTEIGDSGGMKLAKVLKEHNKTLTHLDMPQNELGDKTAAELGQTFGKNTSLVFVNVSRNKITDKGIIHLVEGAQHNKILKHVLVSQNKFESEGSLKKHLEENPVFKA